ncbi:DUF4913 domain-containing protein [Yinghuangia sp. YIM S09857]|uniref:DUF4913 domain-containing protein n=1 Tax=Yinghuangia sp. YIM S09857 TaxID=3436929 RepID=UPI003F534F2D
MISPTRRDLWGQGRYAPPVVLIPPPIVTPTVEEEEVLPAAGATGVVRAVTPTGLFDSAEHFVNKYLAQIICRRLGQGTALWCPEWWRHAEAVIRLDSLWGAFEACAASGDPLAMSSWWVHHADPHLRTLLDPDYGPFAICDPDEGHARRPLTPLPVRDAPSEAWNQALYRLGRKVGSGRE